MGEFACMCVHINVSFCVHVFACMLVCGSVRAVMTPFKIDLIISCLAPKGERGLGITTLSVGICGCLWEIRCV